MVGLRKTTVDHHQPSTRLDRILALGGMHGHVAVDDMPILSLHLEGIEDAVADFLRVAQFEIIAFLFLIGFLVLEEVTFKGGHLRLVEQRGVLAAPEIEEVVLGVVFRIFACGRVQLTIGILILEGRPNHHPNIVH